MSWIEFTPVYMKRVWGGNNLARLFGRESLADPIGESWEIVDRPDVQSRAIYAGQNMSLRDIIRADSGYVMGPQWDPERRFPVLVKLLDCNDVLSVQVHPPRHVINGCGDETKDELWYVMDAIHEDTCMFVGLRGGVTQEKFARSLREQTVAECLHVEKSCRGRAIFVPSGRVHALGPGNIILEIQENSDTTYRVYDWDRCGLDGAPRQLHVEQALKSINFNDHEPQLTDVKHDMIIAQGASFSVVALDLYSDTKPLLLGQRTRLLHVVEGVVYDQVRCMVLQRGATVLLPYAESFAIHTLHEARILLTTLNV